MSHPSRARPVTAPNPAPEDALTALSEASGDPEAFRLVYSVLMQRYDDSIRVGHMTEFADEVAAIAVQTLRDAGRLLPPDGELLAEFNDLTPIVEESKRGTPHAGHEGWSISGDPQLPRCSCGEPMTWLIGTPGEETA